MGLFSKSKKSEMRPLSESEIQNKLYGELRSKESPRTSFPKPASSSAPQVKPPFSHSHTEKEDREQPAESSVEYNPPITTEEEPAGLEDYPAPKLPPRQDLFELPEQQGEEKRPSYRPVPAMPSRHEKTPAVSKPSAAHPVKPVKKEKKEEPRRFLTPEQQQEQARQREVRSRAVRETGVKLASSLAIAAKTILSVLVLLFVFVFKTFSLIDFRKPLVRRVLYWVVGIVALVALFGAVHQLNVKREEAMRARPAAESSESRRETEREVRREESPVSPVQEKPEPRRAETRQPEREAPAQAPENRYVIQVATYATPEDAENLVDEFGQSGLRAFSKSLGRPGGRTYYSVFVGRFKDYAEAQREFEKFRATPASRPFQDAFIRTLD